MTDKHDNSVSGLNFLALPDDRSLGVRLNRAGKAEFVRHNMLVPPEEASDYLSQNSREYWYPQSGTVAAPSPEWIINTCTDPDTFRHAMTWLDETYGSNTPIFNHPRSIAMSSRERQAQKLTGINDLVVPHCVRFRFETVQELVRTFEEGGFRFPVLVRPNELQTGQGMKRIDSHDDWEQLLYTRWFRRDHMMIQFEDCQTDEGIYLKARVVLIGGKPHLRHVKASNDWLVHNASKQVVKGFPEREMAVIDQLEAEPSFMEVCEQIGLRARLDFCGVDIGIDVGNKRYVLFEANPSMSIFFPLRPNMTDAEMERRKRLQGKSSSAFLAHLMNPTLWLTPGQQ
jgi:glutathione synthase/RimK-type ligase-like ATP-grasp enzyme